MRLDRWIEELNTLPAEAPEWDHVSPFLQRLYQLAEAKHEERRVSRNRLGAVVDTLLQECGGELAYFGRADCSSWDVDGCPIPMVTPLVEQVEQFTATLRLHGRVRGQVAATLAEDQERLRTLMQLQEDVQRRYVLINQVLSGGGGVLPPDGTTSGGGTPGGDAAVAGEAGSGAASPAAATPAMSGVAAAGPAEPVPGPESGSVAEAVSGPGTGLAAAGVGLVVSASADMTDGVVGGRLDGLASAGTSGAAEVSPTSELEAGENTPPPVGYPDGAAEVVPPGLGGVAPLDEADEVVPCPPVEGPSEPAPQPAEAARGETIASLPREGSTEPELSEENAAVANPPFDEVRAGPGELLEAGQDPYAAPPGEGGGPAAAALASVPFPVAAAPPPVPSVPGASQGETENAPRQWRPPGGEQQESHVPVGIAAALGGAAAALGVARLWKQPDLAASPSAESASPLAPGPAAQPWEQVEEPTAGVDATPLPQPEAAPSAAPVPLDLVSAAEPLGAAAVEAPRLAEPELTEPADEPVARDVPEPEVAASALLTETTVLPPVTPTITVPELLAPAAAVSQPDPERAGEAAPCEPVLESAAVVETPVAGGTPARAPLGGGGTAREIPAALKALLEQDLAAGAPWETRVESRPSGPAAMLIQPPPAPVGEGALERHAASLGSVVPPASEPASGYAPWQTPGASVAPQGTAGADDAVQSVPAVPVGEEHGEGTAVRAAPGTAVVEEPWPASAGLPDPDAVWRRVSRERILDPHLLAVRHIVAQLGRREHHAWRTVGPVPVLERPKTAGSGESRPPDAAGGGGAPDSSANGLGFRTVQAGGAARESPASSAPGSADETEGGDGELDVAPSGSIAPQATASANGGPAGEVVRLSGETSPPAAPAADVPHGATLAGREPSPNPSELNPDRMAESEIVPAATGREAQAETVLPAEAPGEGVTYTASALPVAPDPKPAAKETASDGTLPVRPPPATFSVPRPAGLPVKTLGNWKRLAPIVGILAAIGVPLAAWNHSDRPMPSKRLADGSRLTLEYVSSGHVHR
ncbi:MAG: hypothetical protein FJX77_02290, partial [Armatimonadetes bacterium]|nr:hypothetical protein [Armatimonadota bacterium]